MSLLTKLRCFPQIKRILSSEIIVKESIIGKRPPIRQASLPPGIRPRSFNESKYIKNDKIPEGFTMIYRAPMENYFFLITNVSTLSAAAITGLLAYKFSIDMNFLQISYQRDVYGLLSSDTDLAWFAAGFIFLTMAVRIMVSRYPLRIYRNDKRYIAILQGQIPFMYTRREFVRGELTEARPNPINPWRDATYKLKNKSVILLDSYFKTPSELTNMLYDNI